MNYFAMVEEKIRADKRAKDQKRFEFQKRFDESVGAAWHQLLSKNDGFLEQLRGKQITAAHSGTVFEIPKAKSFSFLIKKAEGEVEFRLTETAANPKEPIFFLEFRLGVDGVFVASVRKDGMDTIELTPLRDVSNNQKVRDFVDAAFVRLLETYFETYPEEYKRVYGY